MSFQPQKIYLMNIAIIPARAGSKGLPGKNILHVHGRPLISWTISAAQESNCFDRIVVTSDGDNILEIAGNEGVIPLRRPAALATDTASSFDVLIHAILTVEETASEPINTVTLLQPTSPLRHAGHIKTAFSLLTNKATGVISVYSPNAHPMKAFKIKEDGFIEGAFTPETPYQARQTLPDCCYANGSIYIFRRHSLTEDKNFPRENVLPYFMSATDSIDIDTREDLTRAEHLLRTRNADIS